MGPIIAKVRALCWCLLCAVWGRQSFQELGKMDQYKHCLDLETPTRERKQVRMPPPKHLKLTEKPALFTLTQVNKDLLTAIGN